MPSDGPVHGTHPCRIKDRDLEVLLRDFETPGRCPHEWVPQTVTARWFEASSTVIPGRAEQDDGRNTSGCRLHQCGGNQGRAVPVALSSRRNRDRPEREHLLVADPCLTQLHVADNSRPFLSDERERASFVADSNDDVGLSRRREGSSLDFERSVSVSRFFRSNGDRHRECTRLMDCGHPYSLEIQSHVSNVGNRVPASSFRYS